MVENVEKVNLGRSWVVAISVILMCVACSISMFTVPATMVFAIESWGLSVADASWMMTIVAVVATILALPSGMILDKIGARKTTLIVMCLAIVGNLFCWLAPGLAVMLVGRALQGIAYGLVGVFAPALISLWFPPEKRGLPMAIECLYVAIGMTLILNMANGITPALGWQGNYIVAAIFLAATLVLYMAVGNERNLPKFNEVEPKNEAAANEPASVDDGPSTEKGSAVSDGLKSVGAWLLLVVMLGFGFGQSAFSTYYPTYLSMEVGMDAAAANTMSSVASLVNIVVGICVGIILTKIGPKRFATYIAIAMALVVVDYAIQFNANSSTALAVCIYSGIAQQLVPAAVFTMAPLTAKTPASTGTVLGIVNVGVNLCAVFGNAFVGYFVNATGSYASATVPLTILACIGLAAAIVLVFVMKRKLSRESRG